MHERIQHSGGYNPVANGPSLSLWEALTRQGMNAASEQQKATAFTAYEHALTIARRLIEAPPPGRDEDCIAALVVSHQNLADLHADQGNHDDAARLLCQAHEFLIALSLNAERPATLRRIALRHSRETHVALIRHLARYGQHPLIARTLDDASLALSASGPARH
jgi:hypothetical protein